MFDCKNGGGAYFRVTAESGLNIRKGPSLSSDKITKIPYGSMVYGCEYCDHCQEEIIEGKKGIWKKVFFAAYEGFVFSGFLDAVPKVEVFCPSDWMSQKDEPAFKKGTTYFGLYEDLQNREQSRVSVFEGQDTTYENPAIGVVRVIKQDPQNSPSFIVSGIDLAENQTVDGIHFKSRMLYPGESIPYGRSIIYAVGDVDVSEESSLEPVQSIRNYKLIIREQSVEGAGPKEEVLFDLNLSHWSNGFFEGGARIRWVGDIDGDNKLDILLTYSPHYACYQVILFLSTRAIGPRLLGETATYTVCGC